MATILTKKSDTASSVPSAAQLTNSATGAELAVNTADKRLYTKDSGGNVVELGTNPTSLTTTGSVTSAGASNSGNLNFTGTGNRITGDFSNATVANRVAFQSSTTNGVTAIPVLPNGTGTLSGITLHNSSDTANASRGWAYVSSSEFRIMNDIVGTGTYLPMTFYTGGSERVRIDTSGNLGLGVTPSAWSGAGTIQGQNSFVWSAYDASLGANYYYNGAYRYIDSTRGVSKYEPFNGAHKWFTAPSGTAGNAISFTQAMTLDASGNLGIGVTSASSGYRLHVAGDVRIANSGSETGALQISQASSQGLIQTRYAQPLVFGTDATERARITSSGDLLVGKTTNSVLTQGAVIRPSGRGDFTVDGTCLVWNRISTTGELVAILYAGSSVGSISTNGTTTAYNTSSDYRLKNITGPVTNSGAYIDSLKPVEGTWKADGSAFVGLIAHEVQEVSRTQVATGEKDGEQMQAMDYSSSEIIANLIAELQSLRKRVATLEAK